MPVEIVLGVIAIVVITAIKAATAMWKYFHEPLIAPPQIRFCVDRVQKRGTDAWKWEWRISMHREDGKEPQESNRIGPVERTEWNPVFVRNRMIRTYMTGRRAEKT